MYISKCKTSFENLVVFVNSSWPSLQLLDEVWFDEIKWNQSSDSIRFTTHRSSTSFDHLGFNLNFNLNHLPSKLQTRTSFNLKILYSLYFSKAFINYLWISTSSSQSHLNLTSVFLFLFFFFFLSTLLINFSHLSIAQTHHQWRSRLQPLNSFQIHSYLILDILPSYLNSRLRDLMLSRAWPDCPSTPDLTSLLSKKIDSLSQKRYWRRLAWDLSTGLNQLLSGAQLINFLIFIYDGRHRSPLERLLKLRLVYASSPISRNVSFEFLNRQLVWESITVSTSSWSSVSLIISHPNRFLSQRGYLTWRTQFDMIFLPFNLGIPTLHLTLHQRSPPQASTSSTSIQTITCPEWYHQPTSTKPHQSSHSTRSETHPRTL